MTLKLLFKRGGRPNDLGDSGTSCLSLLHRIRYSIFPGTLRPVKDPGGYQRFFNSLILHFRPRKVPERTLQLTLTWGLGGMAVVLLVLLFTTGLLLKFVYQPFPGRAHR